MTETTKREITPEDQARYDREFNEMIGLAPTKPKTIDSEIDQVLARAGVTREEISQAIDNTPLPTLDELKTIAESVEAKTAEAEAHWFDELGEATPEHEPLPVITPDIRMIEQSMTAARVNASGAAVAVSNNLVPELGHILQSRTSTALAFGFPPAVDTLIAKAKLSPEQNEHLLAQFRNMFVLSAQMRARVQTIQVRGPEDVAAIAEARECWKITRDERLNAEKRKKIVKDPYLRPSQLIDGVFRIWMDEIGPIEKEAKEKAEYAENLEKARKEALAAERLEKLKLFGADGGAIDLGEIDDMLFETLYQGAIAQYNARKAEEDRVERERIEREQAAEAERARLAEENERLKREQAVADARNAELQRAADEERQKSEALEREAARQSEERLAEERRLAAISEAKRLAPDKEKLNAYFQAIQKTASDEMPKEFVSGQAKTLADRFFTELGDLVNRYSKLAESLAKIN